MNQQKGKDQGMEKDMFQLLQQVKQEKELSVLIKSNEKTEKFGLALTREEARELMTARNHSLKKYKRVEFGEGILDKLIFIFCDSQYIDGDSYAKTLEQLQDIFYAFKNETADQVTDEELLTFMREQFEAVCFGDLEYLRSTCLERFAKAVREGYRGYEATQCRGEYDQFSEEKRWDNELYYDVLKELFW